ncbi:hypothetical protein CTAYLR_007320 [Chrysophaeum taylorii]|uniref:ABC transporter domain-containing protein n=1 Tax=Chrysophaeum taylorii TaxID=2483200 RepID=A0AAD7XKI0_9STRA|nr:hypothetical protein CTAYLR_007320 [Chrysophaeum taylorii]
MARLEAVDLAYSVGGTAILGRINVSFEPRSVTAVMGPSGSGKTTLLNSLAMRGPGDVSGSVLVNGVAMTPFSMRLQLSYMPQSDEIYRQLRVREVLEYARRLSNASRNRLTSIVDALGLRSVLENKVSAVSGGQRKRTSAAIEFLSGRPVLLMDEPTSGLDSATAFALGDALRAAAHSENRTVIATIHQPSWALLNKFDAVVLLAPRGDRGAAIVYDSTPADLPAAFARVGAAVPEGTNPADHAMRVLDDETITEKWLAGAVPEKKQQQPVVRPADDEEAAYYPITLGQQYCVLLTRALHMWVADSQQGPLIMKMQLGVQTMIVLLLAGMPFNLSKANAVFYYVITKLPMCMTPLVIILPEEKAVILREYRNGVFSGLVYWLARFTLAVAQAAVIATMSTVYVYPLIDFSLVEAKLVRWWLLELIYVSCIMMLGLGLGIASPSPIAGNKVVVAVYIPWLVTSAIFPPLHMMRPTVAWMRYPNLFTWAVKIGLSIGFVHNGDKALDTYRDILGMNAGNVDSCFQALAIAFGLTFCFGLAATLRVLNKPDTTAGTRRSPKQKLSAVGLEAPLLNGVSKDYGGVDVDDYDDYDDDDDAESTSALARGVAIELRAATYAYDGTVALDDVSVRFPAGTVAIMMGPSGAGKTTLLNLLAGRLATTAKKLRGGGVFVDDERVGPGVFKRIGTLTPQEFALPTVLTVRQALLYTAELRRGNRRVARVEALMDKLGIRAHADTVIGTTLKVGISGGQKKRVSIAMDLLAERPVMLVDEPTTGLDALAALSVVKLLVALAGRRTVLCTLHQPPWSTVCRFDQLVLLAAGRVVFDGPPSELPPTLATRGAPVPPNENPVEHVMAVVVAGQLVPGEKEHPSPVPVHENGASKDAVSSGGRGIDDDDDDEEGAGGAYDVPFWTQYTVLVRRSFYIFVVDPDQFPELLMPTIIAGSFLGLSFRSFGVNIFVAAAVLCALTAHGMTVMSGIVLNIPTERQLVLREHRNGTYSASAYFFARTTVALACAAAVSIPFFVVYYPLVGFTADRAALLSFWACSVLNAMVFALMAGVIGLVCKTPLASAQVSEPIGNAMILFSGCIITRRFMKPYAFPVYYGLPIGYAFEIALTAVLKDKGQDGQDVLDYFDVHAKYQTRDFCVLGAMAFFWLGVGMLVADSRIARAQDD